ncbi:MAG: hypothetical protein RR620_11200 [Clostridium sp.]
MKLIEAIKNKYSKAVIYTAISLAPVIIGFMVDLSAVALLDDSTGYFPVFMFYGMFATIPLSLVLFCIYIFKSNLHVGLKTTLILMSPLFILHLVAIAIILFLLSIVPLLIYLAYRLLVFIIKSINSSSK